MVELRLAVSVTSALREYRESASPDEQEHCTSHDN